MAQGSKWIKGRHFLQMMMTRRTVTVVKHPRDLFVDDKRRLLPHNLCSRRFNQTLACVWHRVDVMKHSNHVDFCDESDVKVLVDCHLLMTTCTCQLKCCSLCKCRRTTPLAFCPIVGHVQRQRGSACVVRVYPVWRSPGVTWCRRGARPVSHVHVDN